MPPLVLVTRPQPQADEWVARLQALGVPAIALPLMGIAAPADVAPVQAAWQAIAQRGGAGETPALVMFVSPNAVARFFALRPADAAWPAGVLAAGVGPGTRVALLQAGVPEAAVRTPTEAGGQFDSEALWALLQPQIDWAGRSVLIVRGEGGRDWLADTLRQHGATVRYVEAYRRTVPVPDAAGRAALQRALAHPAACCWLFSSSEAVGHLPALAPRADWSRSHALATHPRIAEAVRQLGMVDVRQVAPSPQAVAEAVQAGSAP
ncbi:MAG: uroporphyrinogen-III synthase [Aquabacterium sp.]|nr:uroporphyrinogen-III synthase [Aquabacterium sp.]